MIWSLSLYFWRVIKNCKHGLNVAKKKKKEKEKKKERESEMVKIKSFGLALGHKIFFSRGKSENQTGVHCTKSRSPNKKR